MIQITNILTEKQWKQIETLYLEAFPREERKPFSMIQRKRDEGKMDVFYISRKDEDTGSGQFGGLAVFMRHKDLALLDYFAIAPELRSKGLGGEVLACLREKYRGERLFLEVEVQDSEAENARERRRRKAFYLRNGMKELEIYVTLFGVDMELLGFQTDITFEEYIELQLAVNDASREKSILENMRLKKLREDTMRDTDYGRMAGQLQALMEGVSFEITNLANASALLFQELSDINWSGFYLMRDGELVLGPFQGKTACTRIALGKGVCGTAALETRTVLVEDVHRFPGHIACDSASRSEIVIPIYKKGELYGVLDIDSPVRGRFTEMDRQGLEQFAAVLEDMEIWR